MHDCWNGTLVLKARDDFYVEQMPNIVGTYAGQDGVTHRVRGFVRTWEYRLPDGRGPDHQVDRCIDFGDTYDSRGDQKFRGYVFTQMIGEMAGVTWRHETPFGSRGSRRWPSRRPPAVMRPMAVVVATGS